MTTGLGLVLVQMRPTILLMLREMQDSTNTSITMEMQTLTSNLILMR